MCFGGRQSWGCPSEIYFGTQTTHPVVLDAPRIKLPTRAGICDGGREGAASINQKSNGLVLENFVYEMTNFRRGTLEKFGVRRTTWQD